MKRGIGGWLLVATAFIICPCHLPLTLGLLAGLAGTGAIGGFSTRVPALVFGIATAYLVVALTVGLLVLQGRPLPGLNWLARCVVRARKQSSRVQGTAAAQRDLAEGEPTAL